MTCKYIYYILLVLCTEKIGAFSPSAKAEGIQINYTSAKNGLDVEKYSKNIQEHSDSIGSYGMKRKRREISDWFIAPNTHWCGRGNSANGTYNHLGGASAADKCCRKHDHCQYFIPAFNSRYELFNYRPYTLSHCPCDRRFRTCLKMANDADANTIGKLFFNVVQTQCFILATQKICLEHDKNGACLRHTIKQRAELKENKRF